ncbi:DUF1080 domain-containing protein [Agriterribacter sp.]|uniref:3-keto-disaccharide hydrolase n=1 Tax=Agriterribacter sp. TaxID=2821509 RepID=UPI002C3F09B5|nr:DUF1080 domain-containing protein [Agriterribacter sp.]HRP56223.1 DUF1080 domain-containing protein [Agriterribacter sp.]
MKYRIMLAVFSLSFLSFTAPPKNQQDGWISIFDGTLNDWKVGRNASTFSIEDGSIKVNGPVAHIYYNGPVKKHIFKNFEFKADVKTLPGSNSGIYFHTSYQEGGWPERGYEVQVNNSHTDWRRTGSLYDVVDIRETYAKDNEWYTEYIKVEGRHVIIKVNDKVVVDYTEPCDVKREDNHLLRVITGGTFALQGHDPKSTVYYKNIMVKPLAD